MTCAAVMSSGRCSEPAAALIERMCRHEHYAIRKLCDRHTKAALLNTDLAFCGTCMATDGHWCPITARILPGKVGGAGEEVS